MVMVRRRRRKPSISGYFRKILEGRPELLHSKSNEELLSRWLADHPGKSEVPLKVKQNLANLKSHLRRKEREAKGLRGRGAGMFAGTHANAGGRPRMETLEEYIDECLTMAKNLDRAGLEDVIKLLRRARNQVVWKMGQ